MGWEVSRFVSRGPASSWKVVNGTAMGSGFEHDYKTSFRRLRAVKSISREHTSICEYGCIISLDVKGRATIRDRELGI